MPCGYQPFRQPGPIILVRSDMTAYAARYEHQVSQRSYRCRVGLRPAHALEERRRA